MGGKKRGRKPIPLVASSSATTASTTAQPMKSRKRARQVTTLFHKLTRERDQAVQTGDTTKVQECDSKLQQMGGRPEYQRASQLSTSFHSTSKKWVLGYLASNGWIYGIKDVGLLDDDNIIKSKSLKEQRKVPRRTTRILEVGAINTDLLDAAERNATASDDERQQNTRQHNNIHVRSIDLHAMDPRIEEYDFLKLPFSSKNSIHERYDVVVCSMVLNCVTTPADRGKMLFGLFHHLRPGGLCFLTIPKFCVTKSAFLTLRIFQKMLGETGVGFNIVSTKESPRIAFFTLKRPLQVKRNKPVDKIWTKQIIRNKGKKFPNQFSVALNKAHVDDSTLHDEESNGEDGDESDRE